MNYEIPQLKPQLVFDNESQFDLQQRIDALDAEFKVKEIDITFKGGRYFFGSVTKSSDAYAFIKESIFSGLEVQEHFMVLYLNHGNRIIGYHHHSTGTINSTPVDTEIISAIAVKTLAKAVILAHNHPSGNLQPSEADKAVTRKVREALKLFDISLLDHLIITKNGFYSFADQGDRSLSGISDEGSALEIKLREEILRQLQKVTQANSPNLFSMLQTKSGYAHLEEMVIRKVLHDQMIPSAVIPLIESEMEMI